ncbi:MAG: CRISPR system precrRNA processing endoribonuclease RAMP protein Cas6 [Chloroflexi bacterium]|nr:CRISPR system precrRNA processing endoribonuclease RAMP protein Cas6 [Chloroflexota bacterium]
MTNLQLTHLRFDCAATTPIKMGGHYAGNNLRNALANVMRRSTCPEYRTNLPPDPAHAATCPACWLLSANLDPGTVIRAYAVAPPIPPRSYLKIGERFSFALTLFGDGFHYLPYVVLAANEAGQSEGIGPGRREGMGRFVVDRITAVDPLRGDIQSCLAPGDSFVTVPNLFVDETAVHHISQMHHQNLNGRHLAFHFLTPTRLEEKQQLYKLPDFSVLFRRLLYRIDELGRQFAGQERRDPAQVTHLHALADSVRLVDAQTNWQEMWVYSGRKDEKTPLSGFTGTAVYLSDDWAELLPWLVWGQATHVGKSVVKGNGIYELGGGNWPAYWDWLRADHLWEAAI